MLAWIMPKDSNPQTYALAYKSAKYLQTHLLHSD